MNKKTHKSPDLQIPNRKTEMNLTKNSQIKSFISVHKKSGNNHLKIAGNNANRPAHSILSNQSHQVQVMNSPKVLRKVNLPHEMGLNSKVFSKNSKVPTLKSTTLNISSLKPEVQALENSENTADQTSPLQSGIQKIAEQSTLTISALKSQIQSLKMENAQLKQQNCKMNKRLYKLKSLSEQNKKLLKQKIQSFNFQGENMRKFKDQTNALSNKIKELNLHIEGLSQENKVLKQNLQRVNSPKVSLQIQTVNIEPVNLCMAISNPKSTQKVQECAQKVQNHYQSSSSRQSFGGILPLETVIKLEAVKIKIDFENKEQTKNKQCRTSLLQKHQNFWSSKCLKNTQKNNPKKIKQKVKINEPVQPIKASKEIFLGDRSRAFKGQVLSNIYL